jgi:hypothetical protein
VNSMSASFSTFVGKRLGYLQQYLEEYSGRVLVVFGVVGLPVPAESTSESRLSVCRLIWHVLKVTCQK